MAFYTALGNTGGADKPPTLLWTNPNPSSSFASQTVPLDLSKYKSFCIKYKPISTATTYIYAFYAMGDDVSVTSTNRGYPTIIGGAYGNTSRLNGLLRNIKITTTGIEFGTGYFGDGSGTQYAIPLEIYGIEAQIYPDNP